MGTTPVGAALARDWLAPFGIAIVVTLLAVLGSLIVLRRLAVLFSMTPTGLDDAVLASIRRHLPLWCLIAGTVVALRVTPLDDTQIAIGDRACAVIFIVSLSLVFSNLGGMLLERRGRETNLAATSLARNIFRAVVLSLGGLLVLSNLGLSITPLLTALGVGSLAVALALQPTLSNLFAGFHLALARPLRVGDFVQLEGDIKGHVVDIGWRATRIVELPDNVIVVPNSRVAEMVLINYSLPVPEQAALVQVGVSYDSDLDTVERVTCEVAAEVLRQTSGGVARFEPFIRYHTFGDSAINFTVVLRVATFVDRYLVTHEFIKRLKTRYEREGIRIPFPQRVIHDAVRSTPTSPRSSVQAGYTR